VYYFINLSPLNFEFWALLQAVYSFLDVEAFLLNGSFLLLSSPYMPKAGTATAESGGRSAGRKCGTANLHALYK